MLYRIKIILLVLLFPITAHSASWPYFKEDLVEELNKLYAELEKKAEYCDRLKYRKISRINSDWLLSLSEKQRKIALFVVSEMALDKCMKKETDAYNTALINYTAKTNDKTKFNEWLLLNQNYSDELLKDIKLLDQQELLKLANKPELAIPFFPRVSDSLILPDGDNNSPYIYKGNN